ncbi:hypothetical protein SALBM135S_07626 [Streptomyces alboniger]
MAWRTVGLDRPRRPGQLDLVAEEAARGEGAPLDRRLQLLGELEVERDGAAAVDAESQDHGGVLGLPVLAALPVLLALRCFGEWFGHGASVARREDDGKL